VTGLFPEDSAERKTFPVYSGLLQYFPSALAAVAHHSHASNEKHNPGQKLHHDRAKSGDEADALVRHLMEGDYVGMAWRALSLLQKHMEANGATVAPAARNVAKAMHDDKLAADMAWDRARAPIGFEELKSANPGRFGDPQPQGAPKWSPDWLAPGTQHPAPAEALRDHDERLHGPEGVL
jgi:hypothetical protein